MRRTALVLVMALGACSEKTGARPTPPAPAGMPAQTGTGTGTGSGSASGSGSGSASGSASGSGSGSASASVPSRAPTLAVYTTEPVSALELGRIRQVAKPFGAHVTVDTPSLDDFGPPDEDYLASLSKDLTPAERATAAASKGVVRLRFVFDSDREFAQLRAAYDLVAKIAQDNHGFVWDEDTRVVATPAVFRKQRLASWQGALPNMIEQVAIHYYTVDDAETRHRLVTIGMAAYGLPDLTIDNAWSARADYLRATMWAIAQALVEGAPVRVPSDFTVDLGKLRHGDAKKRLLAEGHGASQPLTVHLAVAERLEGDADNRLWAITFGAPGQNQETAQDAAMAKLFGKIPDRLINAADDDAELAAIAKKVQARLPALKSGFAKSHARGEILGVKAPFATDEGGVEWMWVEVAAWEGDRLRGSLDNAPFHIKALKAGMPVVVEQKKIADYLLRKQDGSFEGGESSRVLGAREGKGE